MYCKCCNWQSWKQIEKAWGTEEERRERKATKRRGGKKTKGRRRKAELCEQKLIRYKGRWKRWR